MRQRHKQLAFDGSIHFITTVTRIRGAVFTDDKICREMLGLFEWYRDKFSLNCIGYVLMPDHLHAILHQEEAAAVVPRMIQDFKKLTRTDIVLHDILKCRYGKVAMMMFLFPALMRL